MQNSYNELNIIFKYLNVINSAVLPVIGIIRNVNML